ncbi:hypothetical protein AVV44_gp037 [Cronobacter phage S13]|uniref:hypothetical protein n=1 Tax=Cronobacter phage S13 TaxID=1327935 RepID=UPI00049A50FC|nr:hypothetical protein AVV44_gp037 [Cronobacter phage S13]AIA64836.1 hypothetical protein S13_037 [Cronobacter phage S13]
MKIDLNSLTKNELTLYKRALQAILRTGEVQIVFEKVDGSVTVRRGTLQSRLITEKAPDVLTTETKGQEKRAENMESVRFFDLDINEFRTFRMDDLVSLGGNKPEDLIKF